MKPSFIYIIANIKGKCIGRPKNPVIIDLRAYKGLKPTGSFYIHCDWHASGQGAKRKGNSKEKNGKGKSRRNSKSKTFFRREDL